MKLRIAYSFARLGYAVNDPTGKEVAFFWWENQARAFAAGN